LPEKRLVCLDDKEVTYQHCRSLIASFSVVRCCAST
jgi:hypothetical protein